MRMNLFIIVAAMLATSVALAGNKQKQCRQEQPELPAPTGKGIVTRHSKLELLFTRKAKIDGGLSEGPAVAPDGSIYFSDIPMGSDRGMILRFNPKTNKTKPFTKDSRKSNGLIFDSKGFLLSCEGADGGGRGIARWNVETGERTTIVDRYRGMRFNAPNDICLDKQGRIYFTDPRYVGDEPRELPSRAVYRIEADGSVDIVTENVYKPNGIAISPMARRSISPNTTTERTRSIRMLRLRRRGRCGFMPSTWTIEARSGIAVRLLNSANRKAVTGCVWMPRAISI